MEISLAQRSEYNIQKGGMCVFRLSVSLGAGESVILKLEGVRVLVETGGRLEC